MSGVRKLYIYTNKFFHKHTSLIFTLLGASTASLVCLIQKISNSYSPAVREYVDVFSIAVFAAAGAIVGKMIYELHYMAMFDFLTRLGNRWFFNIRLTQELEKKAKDGQDLCLAAVDLDNFKQVNDQLGHAAGDELLVSISETMRKNTRNIDAISRWGGDEFVIIFPDTTIEGALEVAGRLRMSVLNCEKCRGKVTISIGVVSVEKEWDKKKCLLEVDLMLASAKKTKNAIAFARAEESGEI